MASYQHTFTSGDTLTPTKLNAARTVSEIVNADIASAAAIDKTKISGTAITAADSGTVTSAMIADGTIVNADINASAAIAGTKIASNFGSQNVTTTGAGTFGVVHSTGNDPHLQISETDASSNNQKWDIVAYNEVMSVRAVNDAYTTAINAIEIQRTGTTIDSVSMPNGNVGIGTSSPTRQLDVVGSTRIGASGSPNFLLDLGRSGIGGDRSAYITGNGTDVEINNQQNGALKLASNNAERLRIDSSGNVGIGTSSPTVKLDVNGGIASRTAVPLHMKDSDFKYVTCESSHLAFYKKAGAYDFYFRKSDDGTQNGSNSAELMIIKDSGNVGIGTASPSTKLEVNGTVTATTFAGNLTGTASAVADGSVSTAKLATATQQSLVPAGAVMPFAMNSAPSGWLAANGTAVSRSTYAALFAAISTTHGSGDGSTTFNLPDLRGIFVRGSGSQTISGTAYSGTFAEKQQDALKTHTHTYKKNTGGNAVTGGPSTISDGEIDAQTGNPSTGTSTETRPANIALLYCIKF